VPTYTAELSPPNLRGLYVGMCGIWCALGFAVSTYFGIAFYDVDPLVQWRVPLALGALWPLIILIGVIFVPESPRYLILNNRLDEALAVMISQHTKGGEEDLARAEFYQMQKQADLDRTMDSSWSSFVTQPSYRKRAIIVIILLFIGQSSGNLVIQNYVR
jgi:MFS family permease